jgi:transposase
VTKAPLAWEAAGKTPPTGGKNGSKRHLLVDGAGVPLALVVTEANRHDVSQLENPLDSIIIERPDILERPQHLCFDAGYRGEPALETMVLRGFIPHIRSCRQERAEQEQNPAYQAHRRVVESAHSWINRFRKILVQFEEMAVSYSGLLMALVHRMGVERLS